MGFGPRAPSPEGGDEGGDEGGIGAEVGEVDAGGAAEAAGVRAGFVYVRMLGPTLELAELGFGEILDEIDRRRDTGAPLALVFDTAAAVRRLYAVELPARDALAALAALSAAEDHWIWFHVWLRFYLLPRCICFSLYLLFSLPSLCSSS